MEYDKFQRKTICKVPRNCEGLTENNLFIYFKACFVFCFFRLFSLFFFLFPNFGGFNLLIFVLVQFSLLFRAPNPGGSKAPPAPPSLLRLEFTQPLRLRRPCISRYHHLVLNEATGPLSRKRSLRHDFWQIFPSLVTRTSRSPRARLSPR